LIILSFPQTKMRNMALINRSSTQSGRRYARSEEFFGQDMHVFCCLREYVVRTFVSVFIPQTAARNDWLRDDGVRETLSSRHLISHTCKRTVMYIHTCICPQRALVGSVCSDDSRLRSTSQAPLAFKLKTMLRDLMRDLMRDLHRDVRDSIVDSDSCLSVCV